MPYGQTEAYGDELIRCCDCSREFVFTAGERRFYQTKGLAIPPKRCPDCRRRRRDTINRSPGGRL